MQHVIEKILLPFKRVFGPVPSDDEEGFFMEWFAELKDFSADDLEKAAHAVKRSFKPYNRVPWPPISLVYSAAEDAKEDRVAHAGMVGSEPPSYAAKRRAAEWLTNTKQGRQALCEDWFRKAHAMISQRCQANPHMPVTEMEIDQATEKYLRQHCRRPSCQLLDLMVAFGTEAAALDMQKKIAGWREAIARRQREVSQRMTGEHQQ